MKTSNFLRLSKKDTIEYYLDYKMMSKSTSIDQDILIGLFLLQFYINFPEEGIMGCDSFKKFQDKYKLFGFGYAKSTLYIRAAILPSLTRRVAKKLNSKSIEDIYTFLPELKNAKICCE